MIQADARHIPLKDESVQTVVTSPPYWGLRDYGIAPSIWGGRGDCGGPWPFGHDWADASWRNINASGGWQGGADGGIPNEGQRVVEYNSRLIPGSFCKVCSAWRGTLGLEPTPELYVEHIVEVFREVRRVLRKDGTCWVNLGDSYAAGASGGRNDQDIHHRTQSKTDALYPVPRAKSRSAPSGLKPKDLCGIPWRVAFALQADGWWLRSDIIWNKPNPMPESVTDRPTKSHEYIFLLAKSKRYYYEAFEIMEPSQELVSGGMFSVARRYSKDSDKNTLGRENMNPLGRNKRSVWTVATQPYPEAHFATFPEDLIKPCILAGAAPGCVVLDPFVGSGTTVKVAQDLGRIGIGLDLKPDYLKMGRRRSAQLGLVLTA